MITLNDSAGTNAYCLCIDENVQGISTFADDTKASSFIDIKKQGSSQTGHKMAEINADKWHVKPGNIVEQWCLSLE